MEAQEGKCSLLAYTKTYALASAFVLGLILLPTLSYPIVFGTDRLKADTESAQLHTIAAGVLLSVLYSNIPALGLTAVGLNNLLAHRWKKPGISNYINIGIALVVATYFLAEEWLPMGPERHYRQSSFRNRMYRHHSCTALVTGDLLRTYPSLVSE